jgi:hypothetical protein
MMPKKRWFYSCQGGSRHQFRCSNHVPYSQEP